MGFFSSLGKTLGIVKPFTPGCIIRNDRRHYEGEFGVYFSDTVVVADILDERGNPQRQVGACSYEDFCAPSMGRCMYLANFEGEAIKFPIEIIRRIHSDRINGDLNRHSYMLRYLDECVSQYERAIQARWFTFNDFLNSMMQRYQGSWKSYVP